MAVFELKAPIALMLSVDFLLRLLECSCGVMRDLLPSLNWCNQLRGDAGWGLAELDIRLPSRKHMNSHCSSRAHEKRELDRYCYSRDSS